MTRLLLLSGLLCAAPLASAQTVADASSADVSYSTIAPQQAPSNLVQETVAESIARRLVDHVPQVRAEALQEAGHHSMFSPDLEGLDGLVEPLLWVMREDAVATHRVMAAQALARIGDAATLRTLSRLGANDPDPQVKRTVRMALQATARSPRR